MTSKYKTILKKDTRITLIKINPDPYSFDDVIGLVNSDKHIEFDESEIQRFTIDYKTASLYYKYKEPFPKYKGRTVNCIHWEGSTTRKQKREYIFDYIVNDILEFDISQWLWDRYYNMNDWCNEKIEYFKFKNKQNENQTK
jgi:hypothetical protein